MKKEDRDKKIQAKLQSKRGKEKTGYKHTFSQGGAIGLENALLINISLIKPNPSQPRKHFKKDSLQELADSIKERGILQPIRVRPKDEKYEIIAGERRWQASKIAGLKEIPCILANLDDKETYIDALMENIQREDLNAIERANALQELRVHLGAPSWDEVGQKLGLKRRHVFNLLGLKGLPDYVQEDIKSGVLTEKHGRALKPLMVDENKFTEAYEKIKTEKMSGNDALSFVKSLKRSEKPENHKAFITVKTANQKYQDLLILTEFDKFVDEQKEELKTNLVEVAELINRVVKKLG